MPTSMQRLSAHFDAFQQKIKEAKDAQNKTIAALAETSGVPYSAVAKICAGTQADPKLYNAAALCDDLGLSLDRLCGLTPSGDIDKAVRRVHALELENAHLVGERDQLASEAAHQREKAEMWCSRFTARQPLFIIVTATVFVLVAMVAVYMMFDASVLNAGLIINGELSAYAWLLIATIAGAVLVSGFAFVKSVLKSHREDDQK